MNYVLVIMSLAIVSGFVYTVRLIAKEKSKTEEQRQLDLDRWLRQAPENIANDKQRALDFLRRARTGQILTAIAAGLSQLLLLVLSRIVLAPWDLWFFGLWLASRPSLHLFFSMRNP